MSKGRTNEFRMALFASEGGGRISVENKFGYIGKYKFDEAALTDLGSYKGDGASTGALTGKFKQDWSGDKGEPGPYRGPQLECFCRCPLPQLWRSFWATFSGDKDVKVNYAFAPSDVARISRIMSVKAAERRLFLTSYRARHIEFELLVVVASFLWRFAPQQANARCDRIT